MADLWADLGSRWRIFEQYFKPYPVCRWAQPAVEAALTLCRDNDLQAADIEHMEIATFHEARRLATARPVTTDQAQYSLPFAVATAVARGRLGVEEVSEGALYDPEVLRLSTTARIVERADFNEAFPDRRFAEVTIVGRDGTVYSSSPTEARGDPEAHLEQSEIIEKFETLASPVLGGERTVAVRAAVDALDAGVDISGLRALLVAPTVGAAKR